MTRPAVISNPTPPQCCGEDARLTTGREIYPHREDLARRWFWKCDRCEAYCGTHPKTREPLGFPAGPELRRARQYVHELLDPLWQNAPAFYRDGGRNSPAIRATARRRVYEFLADKLGLTRDACHTAMFDLETCRRAYRALQGVTYDQIREWAKGREGEKLR